MDYTKKNSETFDRWVEEGWEWGQAIDHDTYVRATQGDWQIFLTPTKAVPHKWFGDLAGAKVLGLAAGGGQQMPILAALGAEVTLMDFSSRQLNSDRIVSVRENYPIRLLKANMALSFPFADEEFDMIVHPVSNVYVENVQHIWDESFRILKPGGSILSGLDNGINYTVDDKEERIIHHLPFNPLKNPEQMDFLDHQDAGVQFSHTLEEQIGGQLKAGFVIQELYEDTNGEGNLHDLNIPTYFATRSVKPDVPAQETGEEA